MTVIAETVVEKPPRDRSEKASQGIPERNIGVHKAEVLNPVDFSGLLREQDGIIEEINLVPGTTSNEYSASLFLDMMPLDTHLAGSAHSHPNGVIFPSDADLGFFPRTGRYHIIVGFPYEEDDWRCFSASGAPVDIGVVE